MIRVVLWLLPCILLMAGWVGWRLWNRRRSRPAQGGEHPGEPMQSAPLLAWLIAVMLMYVVLLGGLAILNLFDGRTHYTPSRYEQGRIVPATVDP